MIVVDGYEWPIPCDINRVAEVTSSNISGMMMDKTYFNDVIGTYLKYSVTLAVPPKMQVEYERLHDVLTAPVDGHGFVIPYGTGTIEITGRVASVSDVLVYTTSKRQYWKGITFDIIANHPSATFDLQTVLYRGRTGVPDSVDYNIGTTLVRTNSGWQVVSYGSADDRRY